MGHLVYGSVGQPTLFPMKTYTSPSVVEYGDAAQITADSRSNSNDDTFTAANGASEAGLGGSLDTCVTADEETCAANPPT